MVGGRRRDGRERLHRDEQAEQHHDGGTVDEVGRVHRVAELREQTADERAGCHAARRAEERQSRGEFRTFAQEVAQARRCGAGGERDGRAVQSAAEHERAERLRRDERRCPEQGDHHGDGHDGPSSVVIGPVTEDR